MRTVALAILTAILGVILVGCDGKQVVEAPRKRPEGIGMSRGTTANKHTPPPAGN